MGLEFVFVLEVEVGEELLAEGGGFPAVFGNFVAADVDVGGGEEVADFVEGVVEEGEGFGEGQ